MTEAPTKQTRFTSFDGTVSLSTTHQRPDRLSHLEAPGSTTCRIARGGGYSYSASSFGKNSLVQDMTRFNRFIDFNPDTLTLKLEVGVRLIELMQWALPRQLHFPVLPGYHLITVGGCVAADVHGKNPYKDGTFSDWVKQLTVFHPQQGYLTCSRHENAELFAMTCGGYGLTGVITDVTLQLAPLPAPAIGLSQKRVNSLEYAQRELSACDADIAYSWHDATPGSSFGRGIVYIGHWANAAARGRQMRYQSMTANSRASLPISVWNRATAKAANTAILLHSQYGKDVTEKSILDASFPFASNPYFHMLFGKSGLRETQFLVADDKIGECLESLKQLICDAGAPTMMLSLKRFKGTQKSLSMSGTGYLVALDCYRNNLTDVFMKNLDKLMLDMGGQPNLSKDSRISQDIGQLSVTNFGRFKQYLFDYDGKRTMRSELSNRLGLL